MASTMTTSDLSKGVSQPTSKANKNRRRLSPAVREQEILSGAIKYFAAFGFEGQVRGLATQLSVSQGLIYRYFPSKEDLIDRVYQVVFLKRWNDEWDRILRDRGKPLQVRLGALYRSYHATVDRYDVTRISLSSAPRGEKIGINYLEYVRQGLIIPIAEEIRAEFDLPSPGARPISTLEEQIVYSLHAKFLYSLTRKHVYGHDIGTEIDFLIQIYVDSFFNSLEMSMTRVFALQDAEENADRGGSSRD